MQAPALCIPLTDCSNETPVYPDDMPVVQGQTPPSVDVIGMTAGYAEALGIQVLEGRALLPTDAFQEPPAALVNKRAADRMWPGQSALGQRIHADFPDDPPFTVVGVLEDIRSHALVEDPPETLYVSFLGSYPLHGAAPTRWDSWCAPPCRPFPSPRQSELPSRAWTPTCPCPTSEPWRTCSMKPVPQPRSR